MPTYEYECTKCGEVFEIFQSIKAEALKTIPTKCKECKNKAPVVRRIGCGGGIIFRGSGFYQTDYRSENYKKAAKAESESGKPTSKESDGKAAKGDTTQKSDSTSAPVKPTKKKSGGGE